MSYKNFIAGRWVDARSGRTFEDRNPADWDEVIGVFPSSDGSDVEEAVAAARKAYGSWHQVPAPKRGEVLRRAGELMLKYKEELARLMTREMGKVLKEARGDVQEGIDTALYAGGEGRRWLGQTVPSELPNKVCLVFRQPMGVWGVITPWNFPIAIPAWKLFPALLCGNTVVFKPATDTPACAARLVEIFLEAGLPEGCINLVFGSGQEVGEAILNHPEVCGVSFTGSSEVGRRVGELTGRTLKRCSLELGGKNGQVVLSDADMELALEGVLWGAFGTTGQRCTATSRLILEESIHDQFVERLCERAKALRLGNGLDESVEVGPLINQRQLESVDSYVKLGRSEGAELVLGGERCVERECGKGWFYKPTIFTQVSPGMRIAREEIFGPVLSVFKVSGLSEAIQILNSVQYGLSSSIYTRDVNRAFKAVEEVEAGIVYLNGPTIGAECHLPFGGVKDTGNGHREGGWTVFDIFSELKTVYLDYSGRLQKAQIDTWKEEE